MQIISSFCDSDSDRVHNQIINFAIIKISMFVNHVLTYLKLKENDQKKNKKKKTI